MPQYKEVYNNILQSKKSQDGRPCTPNLEKAI